MPTGPGALPGSRAHIPLLSGVNSVQGAPRKCFCSAWLGPGPKGRPCRVCQAVTLTSGLPINESLGNTV